MQWTDESDRAHRAYGEGPYGGVGYPYAHGYDRSGSATGGAATTAWNTPRAGTLAMPSQEPGTTGHPIPGPGMPDNKSVRQVFVDSSGRRQRRVLRAARLLVIPAGGYVALLISTLLGGPSLNAPFVPQPDSHHPTTPHASAPDSSPGTGHSAGSASSTAAQKASGTTAAQKNSGITAAQKTSSPTGRPTTSTTSAATSTSSTPPTGITSPTSTPTSHPTSQGRSIGSSHKPVK